MTAINSHTGYFPPGLWQSPRHKPSPLAERAKTGAKHIRTKAISFAQKFNESRRNFLKFIASKPLLKYFQLSNKEQNELAREVQHSIEKFIQAERDSYSRIDELSKAMPSFQELLDDCINYDIEPGPELPRKVLEKYSTKFQKAVDYMFEPLEHSNRTFRELLGSLQEIIELIQRRAISFKSYRKKGVLKEFKEDLISFRNKEGSLSTLHSDYYPSSQVIEAEKQHIIKGKLLCLEITYKTALPQIQKALSQFKLNKQQREEDFDPSYALKAMEEVLPKIKTSPSDSSLFSPSSQEH